MPQFAALALALAAGWGCAEDESSDNSDVRAPMMPNDSGMLPESPDAGFSVSDLGMLACNPIDGSGCVSRELICTLHQGPRCVSMSGPALGFREACGLGECDRGLACLRAAMTSTQAQCEKLCDLETGAGCESIPGDFECLFGIQGTPFGACRELPAECNPYTQTPCDTVDSCQPFLRRTGERDLRCQPSGDAVAGELCGTFVGTCARGLVCVANPDGRDARCRQYCELNADCPMPLQCAGRVEEPAFTFCLP